MGACYLALADSYTAMDLEAEGKWVSRDYGKEYTHLNSSLQLFVEAHC